MYRILKGNFSGLFVRQWFYWTRFIFQHNSIYRALCFGCVSFVCLTRQPALFRYGIYHFLFEFGRYFMWLGPVCLSPSSVPFHTVSFPIFFPYKIIWIFASLSPPLPRRNCYCCYFSAAFVTNSRVFICPLNFMHYEPERNDEWFEQYTP